MVTISERIKTPTDGLALIGLSTDTKPTDSIDNESITNGSTFYEMDTKKVSMYDAEGKTWIEQ